MRIIFKIIWFLVFAKILFFWLWLWQLKEYHLGRMRAHFEKSFFKKTASGFWRIKFPIFTKKTAILSIIGIFLIILFLLIESHIVFLAVLIFSPLIFSFIVLIFQAPSEIFKKLILKRAGRKIEKMAGVLVIGVTGSYGKTSTKDFLAHILSKKFRVLKTEEHINSEIGIAKTVLKNLDEEKQVFIVEMGAYEKGKIKEVCQMVKPKIGVLTGINEQHLSMFGSLENIVQAKFELIESLPEDGLAVFNGNNELIRSKIFAQGGSISGGKNQKLVKEDNGVYESVLNNLLPWDKENFLMAAAVAESLGMKTEEIKESAENISSRIKIAKGINGSDVILSVYSANPRSVESHLDYLKRWPGSKIIVMPCLIELGKSAQEIHRRIGKKIGQICDLAVITTEENFKEIKEGALISGMALEKIIFCAEPDKIFKKIKSVSGKDGIILLESRVPQELIKKVRWQYGD